MLVPCPFPLGGIPRYCPSLPRYTAYVRALLLSPVSFLTNGSKRTNPSHPKLTGQPYLTNSMTDHSNITKLASPREGSSWIPPPYCLERPENATLQWEVRGNPHQGEKKRQTTTAKMRKTGRILYSRGSPRGCAIGDRCPQVMTPLTFESRYELQGR